MSTGRGASRVRPEATQARAALWWRWFAATAVGWVAGSSVLWLAVNTWPDTAEPFAYGRLGAPLATAALGTAVGGAQWVVLRPRLGRPARWVLASTLGWGIGLGLGDAISGPALGDWWLARLVLAAVLFAAAIGCAQWLVLRPELPHAAWWVLASAVGWAPTGGLIIVAGVGAGAMVGLNLYALLGPLGVIGALLPGAIAGAITGAALVALRHPFRSSTASA